MKKLAPAFLVILSMISCAPSPTEEPMMETEISMTPETPEPEDTSTTATDSETTADEEISIETEDMTITSPPTGTNSSTSQGGRSSFGGSYNFGLFSVLVGRLGGSRSTLKIEKHPSLCQPCFSGLCKAQYAL